MITPEQVHVWPNPAGKLTTITTEIPMAYYKNINYVDIDNIIKNLQPGTVVGYQFGYDNTNIVLQITSPTGTLDEVTLEKWNEIEKEIRLQLKMDKPKVEEKTILCPHCGKEITIKDGEVSRVVRAKRIKETE